MRLEPTGPKTEIIRLKTPRHYTQKGGTKFGRGARKTNIFGLLKGEANYVGQSMKK